MATFDPDAYLSSSTTSPAPPAFDPDAYLASQVNTERFNREVPQLDLTGAPIRQDAMPGPREQPRGMLDYAVGLPEAALAFGSGAVGSVVAPYAGVASTLFGGKYGTQEGAREGEAVANRVQQAMTYQPSSRTGQQITGATGEALQGLGLEAIPFAQGMQAAAMAPAALRQGTNAYVRGVAKTGEAIDQIPMVQARNEARIAQSFQNAPMIDAANLAQKYDIAVDPAITNPTLRNRARDVAIGQTDVSDKISKQNLPKWANIIKEDLGVSKEKTLTAKTFDELKADPALSKAYDDVRAAPLLTASDDVLTKLDALIAPELVGDIGGKTAAKLNKTLAGIKEQVTNGVDGKTALSSIQDLRTAARNIYKADKIGAPISNTKRRMAEIQDATADALESMIDGNLTGDVLGNYQAARAKYAKIYSAEAATDIITGRVNPEVLAKMMREGRPLSGALSDIGTIAANFPDIAMTSPALKTTIPRFTRAGVGGAAGALVGGLVGGPAGALVGTAAGAGLSEIVRQIGVKNMLTPAYQSRRAVPTDYRPQPTVNALRPAEPGQSNIVPFDPRNAVMPPETPGPNFIFGRPDADVRANIPQGPAQLPSPSPQSTLESLRNEDIRAGRMSRMAGQAQEQAAMAAEAAAPRASAGAGIQFDLDPITGRLQPTSRGLPGASLDVVEYANKNLTSAAQKLSGTYDSTLFQTVNTGRVDATGAPIMETIRVQKELGGKRQAQGFQLTAAEKVAFDRTKIDLAIIDPKFKSLSDKEIAAKMFERSSVEDLIQKAKDQAIGFEEIARRSNDQKLIFDANANRQRMLDLAEDLEANLSAPRAKEAAKVKGQGPKTREAITNRLRGGDNVNNLRE